MRKRNHWRSRADISEAVNNHRLTDAVKADIIVRKLQGNPLFKKEVNRTVLTDLQAAALISSAAFEDRLDALYNFADYYRIWLAQ